MCALFLTFHLLGCGDAPASPDGGAALDGATDSNAVADSEANPDAAGPDGATDGGADVEVIPPDNGEPPLLRDFYVAEEEPDRVYFSSNKPIVGSDPSGFTVSNETIVELVVQPERLSGHYVRLEEALDFWDNNTIRYEGGSDLRDRSDRPLRDITLTYVENTIPEPDAPNYRYVTNAATGGGDGLSEETAWTLAEAFDGAEPGMTVWMKAGNYGDQNHEIGANGTATEPIKFIGYKETIGDITDNYWDYGVPFSADEMPTLTGTWSDEQFGRAIYWISANYVVFRNFQVRSYTHGIHSGPQASHANSNLIFDRVNGYDFDQDDPAEWFAYSSFFMFNSSLVGNTQIRFLNSVIMDYEMQGISLLGDGSNLVDNVKIYHDDVTVKPDYQISVNGDNNIIRNCHVEIKGSYYSPSTHGIGIRGGDKLSNTYNLIERSTALNLNEGFYIRNMGSHHNVIKDCYSGNNGATSTYRGGVVIWGGADHNIVERLVVEDVIGGIGFKDNFEEDGSLPAETFEIGRNNLIRNSTFRDVVFAVGVEEQSEGGDGMLYDNQIVNCTFDNVGSMFNYDTNVDVRNLEFINCSFSNVVDYSDGRGEPEGESFSHCNFWGYLDGAAVPEGDGNMSVNPEFVDGASSDFRLRPTSPLIDMGLPMSTVQYDLEGNFRPQGASQDIGACEFVM